MKQKLVALGAVLVMAALFAGRVPTTHADPFSSALKVSLAQCGAGDPSCANPGDGTVQTGESVGTTVHTELGDPLGTPVDGVSFYDSIRTVYSGVTPSLTVPAARVIGTGSFLIHLAVGSKCTAASGSINPTYNIYSTQDANSATYPSKGYAKGLTGAETWATFSAAGWVQDFDDDNNNNVPDFAEGGSGVSTLPMTVRDLNPANGIPDGADKEPLYMPLLDQITGQNHDARAFGDAVVVAGTLEVGVDFVTYTNFPTAGQNTQLAVIQEGAGLGLLPSNNSTASTSTCPPFYSDVTFNNKSAAGDLVQTATGSPISYSLQFSTAGDIDGDGIPDYQDNCDLVPNASQTDTDLDGIGDACDPAPAVAAAADADSDGFPNYVDSCPFAKNSSDTDNDGIDNACDPAPSVVGDGTGYPVYHDHDEVDSASLALPYAVAGNPVTGTGSAITDSNDNFIPDNLDTAANDPSNCVIPPAAEPGAQPCFTLGTGVLRYDSDGDGVGDSTDPNPLNSGGRVAKCGNDCEHDGTTPSAVAIVNYPLAWKNVYGDGCDDTTEAGLPLFNGVSLASRAPWGFYNSPVPALIGVPLATARNTYRQAGGSIGPGIAQAVFAYFKAAAVAGTQVYDQDLNKNNVMDGIEYDRSVLDAGPSSRPDGTIGPGDAQKAFAEFKAAVACGASGTGYRMNDSSWYNGGLP